MRQSYELHLPDGDNEVPGLGEEPPGVRAGERA